MSALGRLARQLVPAPARRALRGMITLSTEGRFSPLRVPVAAWKLRRHTGRLRKSLAPLEAAAGPESLTLEMMQDIATAWSNPGYVGDAGFLLDLARLILRGRGPVLDCGSGISTIVAARLLAPRHERVYSLEQEEGWSRHVATRLAALGLDNVSVWHAPLRQYQDFVWYDLAGRALPSRFAVIACDGPRVLDTEYASPFYEGWRVGVVPVLEAMGITFDHIILDDEEDERAQRLLARWRGHGLVLEAVETPTGRHVIGRPA